MSHPNATLLTLAAVEKLTGLSREVLRKWTLRYRFPQPQRGKRGERQFSAADVTRLQLLSRLIARGHRAGAVVPLQPSQLQTLLDAQPPGQPAAPKPVDVASYVQGLLTLVASADFADALELWLDALVRQLGPATFVAHVLPAFNQAVGDAWQAGRLGVHAEHRYTETLRHVVPRALPHAPGPYRAPRVLLTTPPYEQHALGLLALQVQLRLAGAEVISLGTQLPVDALLAAASDYAAQVVAISISVNLAPDQAAAYLQAVRAGLTTDCRVWVGGAGCAALSAQALLGCEVFSDTSSAVLRWQQMAEKSTAEIHN